MVAKFVASVSYDNDPNCSKRYISYQRYIWFDDNTIEIESGTEDSDWNIESNKPNHEYTVFSKLPECVQKDLVDSKIRRSKEKQESNMKNLSNKEITKQPKLLLKHKGTYQHKESIKKLGGQWQKNPKGWIMPDKESYLEALSICTGIEEEELIAKFLGDIDNYNAEDFVEELNIISEDFFPSGISMDYYDRECYD